MRQFLAGCLAALVLLSVFAFGVQEPPPACAISLDKMNVLYCGVYNEAHILVRGVPEETVRIETSPNLSVKKESGDHTYNIRATSPGTGTITVSGGALKPVEFTYRVKRVPDPDIMLGAQDFPDTLPNGTFKAQSGVAAVMYSGGGRFGCGNCDMVQYRIIRLRQGKMLGEVLNESARYNPESRRLIDEARPGDEYWFTDCVARCPGDTAGRPQPGLRFVIR